MKLTIHKVNERLVVTLPDEVARRFGWGSGDVLSAEIDAEGLTLVRIETEHDHAMRIARGVMDEYSEVLEQLAKT